MTNAAEPSFVTWTRTLIPASYLPPYAGVVSPEKARRYDAQNAAEALSHQVGILLPSQGAPGYPLNARIRGASPLQTLVLMDGRPVEGAALGAADLSEIPLEQIDHIEIVRGGLSALYGPNALGGVINVITKRATYAGLPISHVSYESASYGRQIYKLDFGSRVGPVDYFFFGNQQWQSGFRSNTDNSQHNIGGNAGVSMGGVGKLLFDAGAYHNNAGLSGFRCGDITDAFCLASTVPLEPNRFNDKDEKPASTPSARRVTDSSYARASYLVDLPKEAFLAARVFGHEREADFNALSEPNPANAASVDRREHSKGGDLQLSLPYGFLVGGSFIRDQENVSDRLFPSNSFSSSVENWGVFAQETLHWNSLLLTPSGRYDKNSQFGDTANPRVQGMVDATERLRFSASVGRSFRAPTLDETHFNPSLRPEKAWTYEAGFELHESSKSFRANYFRANVGDGIQTSSYTASNLERTRRQGMEIQVEHVASEYFHATLNYTYLENLGVPAGFSDWVPLALSPRHVVNLTGAILPSKKWEIDPTLRYESPRYSGDNQTGTKMGSRFIMDVRLAYQWRQMELFFGINDLLNKRYVEVPGFPLPGRNAYGGIRLRLWG